MAVLERFTRRREDAEGCFGDAIFLCRWCLCAFAASRDHDVFRAAPARAVFRTSGRQWCGISCVWDLRPRGCRNKSGMTEGEVKAVPA